MTVEAFFFRWQGHIISIKLCQNSINFSGAGRFKFSKGKSIVLSEGATLEDFLFLKFRRDKSHILPILNDYIFEFLSRFYLQNNGEKQGEGATKGCSYPIF